MMFFGPKNSVIELVGEAKVEIKSKGSTVKYSIFEKRKQFLITLFGPKTIFNNF